MPTQAELDALHARIAELEAQLAEQARATNAIVARSQEKLYWLERWHIDLDQLMLRRSALALLAALKPMRAVFRRARRLKRRASGQA